MRKKGITIRNQTDLEDRRSCISPLLYPLVYFTTLSSKTDNSQIPLELIASAGPGFLAHFVLSSKRYSDEQQQGDPVFQETKCNCPLRLHVLICSPTSTFTVFLPFLITWVSDYHCYAPYSLVFMSITFWTPSKTSHQIRPEQHTTGTF